MSLGRNDRTSGQCGPKLSLTVKVKDLVFTMRTAPGVYVPIPQPEFNRDVCQFNTQKC